MEDLNTAKQRLIDDKTCVCVRDNVIYESSLSGIRPMLNWLNEGIDLNGFSVADKIVGKAAASLFICAGIKEVFTFVISKEGLELLKQHNIAVSYELLIDKIINRSGDDICPMEKTLIGVNDPYEAYALLNEKVKKMSGK